MAFLTGRLLVIALLIAVDALAGQGTPRLNKSQRDTLQSVVAAVDAAATAPHTADFDWQLHVLRTSDGSHYIAFTVALPPASAPRGPTTIYVRLATRPDAASTSLAERSGVMEWLKGMRSEPLVAQKRRGIAFGEMPVYGPGSSAARGASQQATDVALLSMERERARERRENAEKARREALEGTATRPRDGIHPFEDFGIDVELLADAPGAATRLQRSITAGPGDYDLYVGWTAAPVKGQRPAVHVVKRPLSLGPASMSELELSSIIVADTVGTRDVAYPSEQQSSHPYVIGPLEIVPARHDTFTNDQRLAIVFQVMNARSTGAGKPDVAIAFQLYRITPTGEQFVGMLNPQFYNATTLPADFDLSKGHPLFVAMAAPLKTLARGEYRLRIGATDKVGARSTGTDVSFRVVATPQTLLSTAPAAPPFRREDVLGADALGDVAARLRSPDASAAMAAALDAARDARFMDLLRDDAIGEGEQGARAALKGIGLYALGDGRIACTILRQSMESAPSAATLLYLGACRALERNDRDAITAWRGALAGHVPPAVVVPLLVGAHLRLGEAARAQELAERLVTNNLPPGAIVSGLAAAYIAQGREADAIPILQAHLTVHGDDLEATYGLLHALFAGFVGGQGMGAAPEGKERFRTLARRYIDAKGRNAVAVSEWLEMVKQ